MFYDKIISNKCSKGENTMAGNDRMHDDLARKEQLKQSIARLLEQADERKLDNIYHFVLHIIK